MEHLTPTSVLAKLSEITGRQFMSVFVHGSLEVEIYKPSKVDLQKPHTRDEVYVVISGSGQFTKGEARHPFQAGEVLFVPAGVEHRFEDFTEDFATWVFFYGPEGGEVPPPNIISAQCENPDNSVIELAFRNKSQFKTEEPASFRC